MRNFNYRFLLVVLIVVVSMIWWVQGMRAVAPDPQVEQLTEQVQRLTSLVYVNMEWDCYTEQVLRDVLGVGSVTVEQCIMFRVGEAEDHLDETPSIPDSSLSVR